MEKRIAEYIMEKTEGTKSVYLGGSRAYGSEKEGSDWDFFGIVNEDYDFGRESQLNEELSDIYDQNIKFRGISLEELNEGEQKGILTLHIPVEIVLKSFRFWEHLAGIKYEKEDFEVDPATNEEEKKFYLKRIKTNRMKAEKGELPFSFEDYVKTVLLLIGIRQVKDGKKYTMNYEKIKDRSKGKDRKLAEICIKYRKTGEIDRNSFFYNLDSYLSSFDINI